MKIFLGDRFLLYFLRDLSFFAFGDVQAANIAAIEVRLIVDDGGVVTVAEEEDLLYFVICSNFIEDLL